MRKVRKGGRKSKRQENGSGSGSDGAVDGENGKAKGSGKGKGQATGEGAWKEVRSAQEQVHHERQTSGGQAQRDLFQVNGISGKTLPADMEGIRDLVNGLMGEVLDAK